ncbi:single-stranded DNA-binding protein [Enterococcus sp. DIV0660C]|uniref:single-stranded DNA-binding protein n=1 Tax=Enterococcus sp. DIV0660C TaxID=2230880 RepID=UPI001A8D6E49|nr:single-stranded DNA-binding protein [Enterococcus sp. DIV0660C]MBO0432818.1 single-stranded DNA-binding protein [Enterococcus sp. DIV0660C]
MNTSTIVGRLTKEADLRYTSNGKAVANFTLASKRSFPNQNGEIESDFLPCVLWGKQAEALANYTRKGSLIYVTGEQRSRNYDDQQGNTRYVIETLVGSFELLETKEQFEKRNKNS